ncbi:MFS transporter [Swaminathania salitolerans]|uniref:MFS transporter n=1 Tax=Swaminathania salitolerans TaxID=182838 RepID=A0A511BNC9_9PROT|nr:MFS transporter [Swaminathania salitolerans]GBQ10098.1 sugar transport protein [Swaminathania salitolerans LMG 21291]GEL01164.1 MFS transporter [Swaminathania salitolerans]
MSASARPSALSKALAYPPLIALRPYWRVTIAAFLGWFLDAFDQTALLLTLPDISHEFGVTLSAMGTVLLAQSIGRAIGNTGWGWLADRYGRRLAFLIGVLWFGFFSAATGLSHGLVSLIVIQFLFGIGFGGEWTASAALLMESVPASSRAMASAIMMSGYELGFLAATAAQALILPHYSWRLLFFIGLAPALLALFIRWGVKESPVWALTQEKKRISPQDDRAPHAKFVLTLAAIQAIALMSFLEFQKAAIYSLYPTILRSVHHLTPALIFWPIGCFCIGSLVGKLGCGALASRFGDLRVILGTLAVVVLTIYPFLSAEAYPVLLVSAAIMGLAASGVFALVPHYLAKRFPSDTRSFGMGLSYAIGSLGQGLAGKLVPVLGRTVGLSASAQIFVIASSVVVGAIALIRPAELPGETMETEH